MSTTAAARPILQFGAEVLATPCAPVTHFDQTLAHLVEDMHASMRAADGVGLAANQIGIGLRVFVLDCPDERGGNLLGHVVNPILDDEADAPRELEVEDEACLSLPGCAGEVPRLATAGVRGFDVTGAPIRLEGHGLAARCLQHEMDHLDGLLYPDRLSARKRRAVLRAHRNALAEADGGDAPPADARDTDASDLR